MSLRQHADDRLTDEDATARRIAACLDPLAQEIDPAIARRLAAARNRALAGHRPHAGPARRLVAALALDGIFQPRVRQMFVLFALVCAALVLGGRHGGQAEGGEFDEIDAALLSDELPIDAYLDTDFSRWLEQDPRS
ncbi:hypothetical protein dqs_3284 [Azoarcus olearius]|uniref:DUF3619 family protein n=1 Tax=Azoarcus sp. (strain BH72) TaxID=418699 RepID=UPI000806180C|nr:DUF3619 family protein [Azoarcus olearius]ANQ86311.1 hypothetical protein dqs_3284 [Azoarcus olearius]